MRVVNYHVKRRYAIVLALLTYTLLVLWLLFDIQFPRAYKRQPPQTFLPPQTALPKMRSKGPAPVKYYSPPKKQSSTAPQQPTSQATVPQPTKKTTPQPLSQETVKPVKTQKTVLQKKETKKARPNTVKRKVVDKKITEKKEAIPRYKKRSRDKWFKQGSTPEHTHQAYQPTTQSDSRQAFAAQMSHGFSNYVNKKKTERAQYSIPDVRGNRVESLEYEMFVGKLTLAVCEASHAKPLTPHTPLVKGHSIGMLITCDNNRNITDVTFTQPSYDYQITEYIAELLHSIIPPKLPSIHTQPKLTLPLKIYVDRQYYARNISLVPA